jgi:hypothetical protein
MNETFLHSKTWKDLDLFWKKPSQIHEIVA